MPVIYLLDVEEFAPITAVGRRIPGVSERRVGSYIELSSDTELSIDRRATGTRHAVWYSALAGVREGRVVQYDKDRLLVVPADHHPEPV